ncbi:radical SAM protein [Anaerotignum sp. MB30-C6]|uniref:radical SAM protein n=1 Tax=Anaerotignum sp. MB30-C6 TaxID=3070814 RepID=UPI0027DE83D0|nr:radical SAM protein [Anaerotignum sp. MB30-C6]WMI82060.1 radical SAM protein [Anaerotignum sp. MB30-C6]
MEQQNTALTSCNVCPRQCHIDRTKGRGFCHAFILPKVALVSTHLWEEPPISGTKGSGTVFFSHCNLRCVFCQNHQISEDGFGKEITIERLAKIFMEQQLKGLHNINLVSPTHFIPQIAVALGIAKDMGLTIPVVYNSNGYESIEGLHLLDGLVDVYLPDFKYWDEEIARAYSAAPNYSNIAAQAILEMRRQVPEDIFDTNGIMKKGLILRHLILPSHYRDSYKILNWVKESLGTETYVSLLSQYTPMHRANTVKALSRKLTTFEYEKVTEYFLKIGLKNGFIQQRSSATSDYTPIFDLKGVEE